MPSLALLLVVVLAVCGCASVAPPAPTAPSAPADQRAAVPAALAVERRWLQSWFEGTPVLIAQRNDGAVSIDVPREFCFDPGRSSVKPGLAAVLNKVAESLRRMPLARLSLLAAPDDTTGTAPLALQRAVEVHKHLLSRGVPAARLGRPTATTTAAVQLRIAAAPP
jgi:outer membrane protein OmpA-like peptidoglycan-associated protein